MAKQLAFNPNATVATTKNVPRANTAAATLLWIGTAPFPICVAILALAPSELLDANARSALLSCLTSYAAMILAYIGGIQQATALHADDSAHVAWPLVVAGIAVALLGWLLVARTQLRTAGIKAGGLLAEQRVDLLLTALVYGWQAWLEACCQLWQMLPLTSRQLLQTTQRRLPMTIAALSLLSASRYTTSPVRSDDESIGRDGADEGGEAGVIEWVDDTYSLAACAATVLALLGASLAKDEPNIETTRQVDTKTKNA